MGKPISIGVASDTREFTQGVKRGVIEPLEDAADALDDVQRAGDKAGEELEGAFRKAQDETSQFKREQADAAREMSRSWKKAGDDVGDDLDRGFDKAGDAQDEFKREAQSSATEAAASFTGSADDIQDVFQEVAANAFAGFGPAGAVAGLAAAAGLGIFFTKLNEDSEAAEQRTADMYADMAESGQRFLSQQFLQQEAQRIIEEQFDDIKKAAELLELPASTVAAAYAGQAEALAEVRAKADEVAAANEGGALVTEEQLNKYQAQVKVLDDVRGKVGSVTDATSDAVSKYDLLNETANRLGAPLGDAAERARAIADQVDRIPAAKSVRVTVDDAPLTALEQRLARGLDAPILLRPPAAGRIAIQ